MKKTIHSILALDAYGKLVDISEEYDENDEFYIAMKKLRESLDTSMNKFNMDEYFEKISKEYENN